MKSSVLTTLVALAAVLPVAVPAHAAPPAPDGGRISLAALREATLDVPAWPADNVQGPSGPLRFHHGEVTVAPRTVPDGRPPYGQSIVILAVSYGDIDHDGTDETLVVLGCLIEGGSKQIVAYDRDADGRIVSRGQVTATTGEVRDISNTGVRVDGSGVVTARVADYQRCCADRTPQSWQTRGYALRDGRFAQVSGPTRMPLNPRVTETRLTAGEVILGRPVGGFRSGGVDVTVTHHRGAHPERVTLTFYPPEGLERSGRWPRVTGGTDSFSVTVAAPAAGGSVTHRFTFRLPVGVSAGELPIALDTVPQLSPAIPWQGSATARILG
ncbi:hypothetical protein [Actinoplanes awajinensis]|uniref:hypothetical protein n=1 Tax=Actinoplanes awajinensis TaxID=135946 RepID=UPI000AAA4D59|nr:hypothetical protein [Actinoplanes awajinensis]